MKRLGERHQVAADAEIKVQRPKRFGRTRDVAYPVLVLNVSVSGASIGVPLAAGLQVKEVFLLGIQGRWGTVRATWGQSGAADGVYGVEFLDPHPAFLPTIYDWLERPGNVGSADMRD